jgi:teichuronic acid biosynthesis protein TuaE
MIGAIIISFLLGNLFFFLDFKLVVVFSIDRLILIAAVIYCACQFLMHRKERHIPRFTLAVWAFVFAWLVYGMVWLFFSASRKDAISEISCLGTNLGLVFCLGYLIDSKEKLKLALKCLKFCGIFLAILLIIQLFTGFVFPCSRYTDPRIVSYMRSCGAPIVPTTMFNNENDMSAFLILIIALYFSDLLFSENRKAFAKTTIKLTLLFFSIAVINSTISLIALVLMFIIGLAIAYRSNQNTDKITPKELGVRTLAACADLGLFYALIGSPIEKALRNSGHFVKLSLSDLLVSWHILPTDNFLNSTSEFITIVDKGIKDNLVSQIQTYTQHQGTIFVRMNLIIQGLKISASHLLFGIGPNSFERYMLAHPETTRGTNGVIDPHNFWIEILSQYGILIFIPFVVFYVKLIIELYKNQRSAANKETLGLFLAGILFFFSVIIPSSSIGLYPVWVVFAVLVAGTAVYHPGNSAPAGFRNRK